MEKRCPPCTPGPHSSFSTSDNHDIISLKLYQLTVERTPEEERRDKEVFLPVVENMKLPGSKLVGSNGAEGWGAAGSSIDLNSLIQFIARFSS